MKSNTSSKKHENHKTKKEKMKNQAIPTNVHEKLQVRNNKKNHAKKHHMKRQKRTLETATQINTEETIDEYDEHKKYANYISKVARAIAKARGVEVSEEHMDKDIQDLITFNVKLTEVSVTLLYRQ